MDFESLVVKKLEKIEEKQDKHDEKQDRVQADINLIKIKQAKQYMLINQNTKDLTEHKEGVVQNRQRIVSLETASSPLTVTQLVKRIVLIAGGVSAIAGAAIAIAKLMGI